MVAALKPRKSKKPPFPPGTFRRLRERLGYQVVVAKTIGGVSEDVGVLGERASSDPDVGGDHAPADPAGTKGPIAGSGAGSE
jgi:hypothetical protein